MTVTPLDCASEDLTIRIGPGPNSAWSDEQLARLEARWGEMASANPRLFNGPILAFHNFDPETNTIHAFVSDFQHLAVPVAYPEDGFAPTTILSITGVLLSADPDGQPCVCLAQRSHQTRVYGGLWELAPSGGIDAPSELKGDGPHSSSGSFDGLLAVASLNRELNEELGASSTDASTPPTPDRIIGLILDSRSCSMDMHVRRSLTGPVTPGPLNQHTGWEYDEVRWVRCSELERFVRTNRCIPPLVDAVREGLIH